MTHAGDYDLHIDVCFHFIRNKWFGVFLFYLISDTGVSVLHDKWNSLLINGWADVWCSCFTY